MTREHSILHRFASFKLNALAQVTNFGICIADAETVPKDVNDDLRRTQLLRDFARKRGFAEPDMGSNEWKHAEVFREDARHAIVNALSGGAAHGKRRWDVPPLIIANAAGEFLSLFGDDARFFCDVPPTRTAQVFGPYDHPNFSDYIYSNGCVAIDCNLVAVIWALNNE
jgi:hypothetical protein